VWKAILPFALGKAAWAAEVAAMRWPRIRVAVAKRSHHVAPVGWQWV